MASIIPYTKFIRRGSFTSSTETLQHSGKVLHTLTPVNKSLKLYTFFFARNTKCLGVFTAIEAVVYTFFCVVLHFGYVFFTFVNVFSTPVNVFFTNVYVIFTG